MRILWGTLAFSFLPIVMQASKIPNMPFLDCLRSIICHWTISWTALAFLFSSVIVHQKGGKILLACFLGCFPFDFIFLPGKEVERPFHRLWRPASKSWHLLRNLSLLANSCSSSISYCPPARFLLIAEFHFLLSSYFVVELLKLPCPIPGANEGVFASPAMVTPNLDKVSKWSVRKVSNLFLWQAKTFSP